jgi:multiple sugar transport system permease protein
MGLFRTIFYLPSVVPVVASAIMWKLMFDTNNGPIDALIQRFGGQAVVWLLDPNAFKVLIIVALWALGGGMVISLAALQGVPQELIESASLDGANGWQTFLHIMLPLLSPVLFFQLVTSFIAAMQTFIQPLLLSPVGQATGTLSPQNVPEGSYLYMVHVYAQFFNFNRFGYGSALLWVLFGIILLVTILFFRTSALWVFYEVERE